MAEMIKFDDVKIEATINQVSSALNEYQEFQKNILSAISHMRAGMDAELQNNMAAKGQFATNKAAATITHLNQTVTALNESKNTYTSADAALAKVMEGTAGDDAVSTSGIGNMSDLNLNTLFSHICEVKPDEMGSIVNFINSSTKTFDVSNKSIGEVMDYVKTGWVDEELDILPLWKREHIKAALGKYYEDTFGKDVLSGYDIISKIADKDYRGAAKKITKILLKKSGTKGLETDYWTNTLFYGQSAFGDFIEEPSVTSFANILWSPVQGVFETAGLKSWDVVKKIPFVSDYYEEHGINSYSEAFNHIYSESMGAVFGDSVKEYTSNYYSDHGGLFGGLAYGFGEIKDYVSEYASKHNVIDDIKSYWNEHSFVEGISNFWSTVIG